MIPRPTVLEPLPALNAGSPRWTTGHSRLTKIVPFVPGTPVKKRRDVFPPVVGTIEREECAKLQEEPFHVVGQVSEPVLKTPA